MKFVFPFVHLCWGTWNPPALFPLDGFFERRESYNKLTTALKSTLLIIGWIYITIIRWWMGHKWMTFLWGEKPSSLQGAFHVMLIRQELSGEQLLIEVIKIFCFSTEPAISELRVIKSRLLSFKSEEFVRRHKYCPQLDPQFISLQQKFSRILTNYYFVTTLSVQEIKSCSA